MNPLTNSYDTIVIGLGAIGSATLYQLALSGKRVLGIDQFSPPHSFSSSHGETRITRQAIGEGEAYVPFAIRSHELWRDIEKKTNKNLLFPIGGLVIGDVSSSAVLHSKTGFLANTISTAEKFGIPHEVLDTASVRKKFPQFAISNNDIGYYEFGAGYVRPEECIRAQLALAKKNGAEFIVNQKVSEVGEDSAGGGVIVRTGDHLYQAEQVVIAAGPWISSFLEIEKSYFKIYRQVLFWFSPTASVEPFLPDKCPIFIWSFNQAGGDGMYGFPAIDGQTGGVKVAGEQYQITTTPETVAREVSNDEIDYMYLNYVKDRLPKLSKNCLKAVSCMYTTTPNSDFVIQRHPKYQQLIIASPCSGHGFKHSAAIGETLAELVTTGKTRLDISKFRVRSESL